MNTDNFFSEFSTESACKRYFKSQRESKGIVCRNVDLPNIIGLKILVDGNVKAVENP